MSGHNKWSTIKHKKGKTDAQRARVFTKIGREIAIAVREGGPNPDNNSKLRDVIAKAKASNMPNDNINRSIQKAAGEGSGVNYEEITYEGYGAGGVAVMVETLTDNRNRTASDVRHIFDKFGGSMGTSGCVAWILDHKGVLVIERTAEMDEDEVMMAALDAGAQDFDAGEEAFEIQTGIGEFSSVREALEQAGYSFISAEISWVPQQDPMEVSEDVEQKLEILIDRLEELDDVQAVYHNADM